MMNPSVAAQAQTVRPAGPLSPEPALNPALIKLRALSRSVFGRTMLFSFVAGILRLAVPANMLAMYSIVIPSKDAHNAYVITAAALGALLVMGLLELVRSRLMIRYGVAMNRDLSDKILSGMLKDAAELSSRGFSEAMNNLHKVRNFVSSPAVFAFFDCLLTPVLLLIVFLVHPVLGLTALVAIIAVVLLTWKMDTSTKAPLKKANVLTGRNNFFLQECLRGRAAVQAMGMTGAVSRIWREDQDKALAVQSGSSDRAGRLTALSKLLTIGMPVLMLAVGAYLVINSPLGPGMIIIGAIIASQAIMPLHQAMSNWTNLQEARRAYGDLKDVLAAADQDVPRLPLPAPEGALSLEQVVFALPGQAILRGVSLSLEPGEFLGVIGPMAAGKTTLARLLTGVIRPSSGTIRLDGADMFSWEQTRLGRYLGYLPQEVELFPGTVRENIARMGQPEEAALADACALAGLDQVVQTLPQGLDTMLEDGGSNLPGGLRQRIGLARALYGAPRVVILDEPDSNLDEQGVAALTSALAELKGRRITVVMITHRVSLITRSDRLLVLQQGMPVHYGPTAEVLAKLQNK